MFKYYDNQKNKKETRLNQSGKSFKLGHECAYSSSFSNNYQ
jgi:hypothetical protein